MSNAGDRTSLGQSIERKVTGAATIPETFVVHTQAYVNAIPEFTGDVTCTIDIDLAKHRFEIAPRGDELQIFLDEAAAKLRSKIEILLEMAEYEVKGIFYGSPCGS